MELRDVIDRAVMVWTKPGNLLKASETDYPFLIGSMFRAVVLAYSVSARGPVVPRPPQVIVGIAVEIIVIIIIMVIIEMYKSITQDLCPYLIANLEGQS